MAGDRRKGAEGDDTVRGPSSFRRLLRGLSGRDRSDGNRPALYQRAQRSGETWPRAIQLLAAPRGIVDKTDEGQWRQRRGTVSDKGPPLSQRGMAKRRRLQHAHAQLPDRSRLAE